MHIQPKAHPIGLVLWVTTNISPDAHLEFSRYVYRPQSVVDERDVFHVRARELSVDWLVQQLDSLDESEELAFHSRLRLRNAWWQLPMVDFTTATKRSLRILNTVLPAQLADLFQFYWSGRSFHAYAPILLTQEEWVKVMGNLLLANMPDRTPIVDARWIGHRLVAGYGALRWSRNSNHYRSMPKKVSMPSV
jgi:hypothetical protein